MNKKMLIIIAAVVLVVIVGAVAAIFLLGGEKKEKPVVYYEYTLGEEYSNLADQASRKIVKYQITIEYTDQKFLPVLEANKTKIRNNIDEIMRATTSEEIERTNGKQRLRDKIRNMVIEELETDEDTITNIYIQPFVIQG